MSVAIAGRTSALPIAGLLLFGAMPLTFAMIRALQLMGVVDIMPPLAGNVVVPVGVHIGGALVYATLGAFQFSAFLRRRWPLWHRLAGRLAFAAGMLVALSALWLTFGYGTMSVGGMLLAAFRVVVGSTMALSLALGLLSILRRYVARHRKWMIRAYALGLGAATQMIILTIGEILTGAPLDELARAGLMGLAWSINFAVAEWVIRRGRDQRRDHKGDAVARTRFA
jgi:hypothetical protein